MVVAVPPLAEDVRVEHPVVERLGVRHGDLAHERPRLLPARPRQREPSERPPDERQLCDDAEHAERGRHVAGHAERCADEHEPPDAPGLVQREDGAHEAADRAAREVDGVELEAVQDVAHEGRNGTARSAAS